MKKKNILISVLYQNASTSRILDTSPLGLISCILDWSLHEILWKRMCVYTVFLNSAFCCIVCTHTNAVRLRIFWSFFEVMQLKWKDLLKAGFQCMPQFVYVVEFSNWWCKTLIYLGKQWKNKIEGTPILKLTIKCKKN